MALVSTSESWECDSGKAEFEGMEVSDVDETLLMSLLEESLVEEAEDERLGYVIRSLEAEINPKMTNICDSIALPESGGHDNCEDCRSQEMGLGLEDDYNWSRFYTSHAQDFDWVNMEMASSSTSDDIGNWYMDPCADDVGLVEFGDVSDYSGFYSGVPMEDLPYSSLWQESYDSVMYN